MSKKPTRKPHHPAHEAASPRVDPDDFEEELAEEQENEQEDVADMAANDKPPEGEPKHPDPKGKMVSHAPGFKTGPHGESVEMTEKEKETAAKEAEKKDE